MFAVAADKVHPQCVQVGFCKLRNIACQSALGSVGAALVNELFKQFVHGFGASFLYSAADSVYRSFFQNVSVK